MPGGKWLATASTITFIITIIVICPAAVWPGPSSPFFIFSSSAPPFMFVVLAAADL